MTIALSRTARAEEQTILNAVDLQALEEYSSGHGFDFTQWTKSVLSGDVGFSEFFTQLLDHCKNAIFSEFHSVLAPVIIPAAILLLLKLLLPESASGRRTAAFVCRLSCIAALSSAFMRMQTITGELLQEFIVFSDALTPALIAASALSGLENAASFLNPMTALCANLIQNLLAKWGIALCSAAAGIAAAGNLSMNIRLKRLQELVNRLLKWGTGSLLAAFTAILSLQGRLIAGRDSAAARTARYAIESLIPIIGGNISDSLDSLLATASVVRNALGCSGLLLLIHVCIIPMSKLLGTTVLLHLASAISEPLGDDALTSFTGQFADSVGMLLILCTAAAVLCMLLIGSCMSTAAGAIR